MKENLLIVIEHPKCILQSLNIPSEVRNNESKISSSEDNTEYLDSMCLIMVEKPYDKLKKFIKERHDKIYPPPEERNKILQTAHIGHFGVQKLFDKVFANGYYWPSLMTDCKNYVTNCQTCYMYNIKGFILFRL
jgi:hypothetical protein